MAAQSREELLRKARERAARRRQTPEYREWYERSRDLRNALKAKYRRQAGIKPRDVEAAAKRKLEREQRRAEREAIRALHDAHCKRYQYVMRCRLKYAARYATNPDAERQRTAERKQRLADGYVAWLITKMGVPREAITPHLTNLKREAVQFRRLSRTVRQAIREQEKEDHEAITEHA